MQNVRTKVIKDFREFLHSPGQRKPVVFVAKRDIEIWALVDRILKVFLRRLWGNKYGLESLFRDTVDHLMHGDTHPIKILLHYIQKKSYPYF